MSERERLKLLVAIVDRDKGRTAVEVCRAQGLPFDYLCMGKGTANSQILDYFGLSETEKDVVITLVPESRVREMMIRVDEHFHLSHPGRGILFTLPLSAVSGQVARLLDGGQEACAEEVSAMERTVKYDLILAVVNRDGVDTVMDAARSCGARGGTVVHARSVDAEKRESMPGFALQPEREIVAILARRENKLEIMGTVNRAAGPDTECRGIVFSLPVEDMMGLSG